MIGQHHTLCKSESGAAMIDKLFKLAVVALAACFSWIYYINAQNGRYQQLPTSSLYSLVLDTREGIVYRPIIQDMPSSTN